MNALDLKARLGAGRPVYGTWSHIPNVQTVEAIGAAGLDFIVFDMEHGPHSFSDMPALYGAAERVGLVPMTRVPSLDNSNVLRTLDSGAKGVVVPHVDGLAAARRALDAMRYGGAPGNRGVATLTRASLFDDRDEADYFRRQNEQTVSVLLIEDAGGLADLDAICALPGLDVVFLGIYDLAQSLGLKRDYADARFAAMFDGAVAAAKRHGVAVGTYAPDAAAAVRLLDRGVRFVTVAVDGAVLRRAYAAIVGALPGRD